MSELDRIEERWLEDSFRLEMPECRIDAMKAFRNIDWGEYLALLKQHDCDLNDCAPDSLRAQRALQLAVIPDLVRLVPREPFPQDIVLTVGRALERSGVYRNKWEFPWGISLLKLVSVLGPLGLAYVVYTNDFGWIATIISLVGSWWFLVQVHARRIRNVITVAALESNSLFKWLWAKRLYAIYDVQRRKTYDSDGDVRWLDVLAAVSGQSEHDVQSREEKRDRVFSEVRQLFANKKAD